MGSCGCGDVSNPPLWAVTVGPHVLAAFDYRGCSNGCAAPLGFTLWLATPEEAKRWGVEPTGEWTPGKYGLDETFLNLFSQEDLSKAAATVADDLLMDGYASLGDVLGEVGLDLMRAAWDRRIAFEKKLEERFGKKAPFAKAEAPHAE